MNGLQQKLVALYCTTILWKNEAEPEKQRYSVLFRRFRLPTDQLLSYGNASQRIISCYSSVR
jgi:hypothetical protein